MDILISKEDLEGILRLAMFAGRHSNSTDATPAERRLAKYARTLVLAGDVEDLVEVIHERAEDYGL